MYIHCTNDDKSQYFAAATGRLYYVGGRIRRVTSISLYFPTSTSFKKKKKLFFVLESLFNQKIYRHLLGAAEEVLIKLDRVARELQPR